MGGKSSIKKNLDLVFATFRRAIKKVNVFNSGAKTCLSGQLKTVDMAFVQLIEFASPITVKNALTH